VAYENLLPILARHLIRKKVNPDVYFPDEACHGESISTEMPGQFLFHNDGWHEHEETLIDVQA